NPDVNQYWMCDSGRMSLPSLQGEGRLAAPLLRGQNEFLGTTWEAALGATTGRLAELARTNGPGSVGFIVSAQAPNEEVFLIRRLAAALGARVAAISWSPAGAFADDFLIKADKNPNTQGLRLQGLVPSAGVDELIADAGAGRLAALVL